MKRKISINPFTYLPFGYLVVIILSVFSAFISGGFSEAASRDVFLRQGLNLFVYPVEIPAGFSACDLIITLGDESEVSKIQKYDPNTASWWTMAYDHNGLPYGKNFNLVSGQGCLVYLEEAKSVSFDGSVLNFSIPLKEGLNLLSLPDPPPDYTSYDFLSYLGSADEIGNVQRFNRKTGAFEAATYCYGKPSGVTFKVSYDEAYVIHMKSDKVISTTYINTPPAFDPVGSKTVNEGEILTFFLTASDRDTDQILTYSAQGLPYGAVFHPQEHRFSWTPLYNVSREDPYLVEFMVTDNGTPPLSACKTVPVFVSDVPHYISPVFYYTDLPITPNHPFLQDTEYVYAITPELPDGLLLDPASGTISGIPRQPSPSTDYTITITDALGSSTTAAVRITVQSGECSEGYYRSSLNSQCLACNCSPEGSVSFECVDGQCACKPGYAGDTCDRLSPAVRKADSDPQLLAIKDIWETCFQGTGIHELVNAHGDFLSSLEMNPHLSEVLLTTAIGRGFAVAQGCMAPPITFSASSGYIGRKAAFFHAQSECAVQQEGVAGVYPVLAGSVVSPLVLDLNGDGMISTSDHGYLPHPSQWAPPFKLFDINGDGFEEITEWLSPDDGLLVKKPQGDRLNGTHLFGSADGWRNGFEKLAALDTSGDSRITGEEMAGLAVWKDGDSDAVLDEGELLEPDTLGLTGIDLNHHAYKGSCIINGQTRAMWDWFPNYMITRGQAVSGSFSAPDIRLPETGMDESKAPVEIFLDWDLLASRGVNAESFTLGGISEGGWFFGLEREADRALEAEGSHFSLVIVDFSDTLAVSKIPLGLKHIGNALIVDYGILLLGDYGTKLLYIDLEEREAVTLYQDNPEGEGIVIGSIHYSGGKVSLRGLAHNQDGFLGEYLLSFDRTGVLSITDFHTIKQGLQANPSSMTFIDDDTIYFTSRDTWNTYLTAYRNSEHLLIDQGIMISDIWANREHILYSIRRSDNSKQLILKNMINGQSMVLATDWFDYLFLSQNSRTVLATRINWATLTVDYYGGLQEAGYTLKHLHSDYMGSARLSAQGAYGALVTPAGIHVKNVSRLAYPDDRPAISSIQAICLGGKAKIEVETSTKAMVRLDLWTLDNVVNSKTPGLSIMAPPGQYLDSNRFLTTFEGVTIPDDIDLVVLCAVRKEGIVPYDLGKPVSQPDAFQIPVFQLSGAIQNGPNLIKHPSDKITVLGDSVTFCVEATGKGELFYQWKKDGLTIPSATDSRYTIFPVQEGDEGSYSCLVTNAAGVMESAAALLILKTYHVCNQLVMPAEGETAGNVTYHTIQSAVDAAEADSFPLAGIEICAGTYIEDVSIKTGKSIRFTGQGTVTVKGTGYDPSVFEISDACPTDDAHFCYGSIRFEGIDIKKTDGQSNPRRAILLENMAISDLDVYEVDRAELAFTGGTIEGFDEGGIYLAGKVDLMVDKAVFTDIGTGGQHGQVILMLKGGEQEAQTGYENDSPSSLSSSCHFAENGHLTITDSSFYNNRGAFGVIVYAENSEVILDGVRIYENEGTSLIEAHCSDISLINHSSLYHNTVGEMLYIYSDSALRFFDSEAYGNTGTYSGTVLSSSGEIEITNSTIHDNTATTHGGGVYFSGGILTSTNTSWNMNTPDDVYHKDLAASYFFDGNNFTCDEAGCN
ncbi:MAG: putative Ig domain-containing protein [bacterium]